MTQPTLHVVSASAGSGKTYRLVRDYIALSLQPGGSDGTSFRYRNILAITFTNKAAGEMKERVFQFLRELKAGKNESLAEQLCQMTGYSQEELQERSGRMYKHMLHHYPDLSIRTIDSFMHTVVRGFARDLQLDPEFEVIVDTRTELAAALDDFLTEVGTSKELTHILRRLAEQQTDLEKAWDIRTPLLEFVQRHLLSEEVRGHLESYAQLPLEALGLLEQAMREYCEGVEEGLRTAANRIVELMDENGLEPSDVSRGLPSPITRMRDFDESSDLKTSLLGANATIRKFLDGANWYPQKASAEVKQAFDRIQPELVQQLQILFGENRQLRDYIVVRQARKQWLNLVFLRAMQERWQSYLSQAALLPVSDFQQRIRKVLQEDPSSFIYERIGQRYRHVMIDEFQDTSRSQWANFLPLLAGGLAEGNDSLIVGDGKQSIYRWRGAEAEQFVQLANPTAEWPPETPDEALIQQLRKPDNLEDNWRSQPVVVQFNNELFTALKRHLGDQSKVYESVRQNPKKSGQGYVEVQTIPAGREDDTDGIRAAYLQQSIRQLQADGFPLEKCAVLVRTRKQALMVSEALRLASDPIPFTTRETLLLSASPSVCLLMDTLAWLQDPDDVTAGVRMLAGWLEGRKKKTQVAQLEHFRANGMGLRGEKIRSEVLGIASPSEEIQLLARTALEQLEWLFPRLHAAAKADPYVEFLFEAARSLAERGNTSVQHLLDWWANFKDRASAATEGAPGAIQIMTIHKSKGLEFEAVLLPLFLTTRGGSADLWVSPPEFLRTDLHLFVPYLKDASADVPAFERERQRQLLDDLNVLYVAATRACRRLYIALDRRSKPSDNWNDYLWNALAHCTGSGNDQFWQNGEASPFPQAPVLMQSSQSFEWSTGTGQRPVVAYEYKKHWDERQAARWQGDRLHNLLARLDGRCSLKQAVDAHIRAGLASEADRSELMELLTDLTTHPQTKAWFAPDVQARCEADLLTHHNQQPKVVRPDRVVIRPEQVDVIDYKSGAPKEAHLQQVREYTDLLSELYEQPVKGYLLYTEDRQVVPVT